MDRRRLPQAMTGTHLAHDRLMSTLSTLRDGAVRDPSLLPGWTRAHVLTHLARNADSHVRILQGAARGERLEQYVGGAEGRARDIEAGADRTAEELVEDVADSAARLFEVWQEMPAERWDAEVVAIHQGQPAWACVFSRWRETEIHHVDLGLGYAIENWPADFVEASLPGVAAKLQGRLPAGVGVEIHAEDTATTIITGSPSEATVEIRGPGASVLAWLAGRSDGSDLRTRGGDLPVLGPWL